MRAQLLLAPLLLILSAGVVVGAVGKELVDPQNVDLANTFWKLTGERLPPLP